MIKFKKKLFDIKMKVTKPSISYYRELHTAKLSMAYRYTASSETVTTHSPIDRASNKIISIPR